MKNEKHIWTFPSKGLKAIFDEEIRGQISDGAWENSAPYNHWHFWCSLDTALGKDWAFKFNSNVDYDDKYPKKKSGYNLVGALLDPECIDLSPRMRAYYVDAELGLGLEGDADYLVNDNGQVRELEDIRKDLKRHNNEYWDKKLANIEKIAPRFEEFKAAYNAYTRDDLIKDLRLIKKQMKAVIELASAA